MILRHPARHRLSKPLAMRKTLLFLPETTIICPLPSAILAGGNFLYKENHGNRQI